MHSTNIALLLTTAIGFLPQTYAQASPDAKLTFCFNGGTTDADCITSSTTFDNACKRDSVPNAPGKTLTLSQVTIARSAPGSLDANGKLNTGCQLFTDGLCTVKPGADNAYSECVRLGWDDGLCTIVNTTESQPSNGKVTLGSWRCGPAAEVHDKGVTATGTPSAIPSATHAARGLVEELAAKMAAKKYSEGEPRPTESAHVPRDEQGTDNLIDPFDIKVKTKKAKPKPTNVPRDEPLEARGGVAEIASKMAAQQQKASNNISKIWSAAKGSATPTHVPRDEPVEARSDKEEHVSMIKAAVKDRASRESAEAAATHVSTD
ncbi:hypothetical protein PMZ80_003025 [Knufia obscura]|uniref:Uncharacterized protein n=2 Tax=Knufia TaxID=430999 RepID=A0AAN8ILQ0_9EURO|nr:hypothetical protein PMZ80_003025 [Knufia obscura]KAK5952387.1 hypothetical protein OHC33_006430 [Knufia fluminis]